MIIDNAAGVVGASRAIQAAILAAVEADPGIGKAGLATVLAAAVAAGDPLRHLVPLFDAPPPVPVSWPDDFPVDLFDARAAPPRVSTRPGRGPRERPRATACRMFSRWVAIRT